ncbi:endonuclease domain-containing protein [Blastomonas sp.]|uniref:endonuclease domain-containing protein n=1 Tax=Blastomonas sp. TaxID=1909299 RepID=UPI0026067B62|nr:endonuclease domain-containing protein [Blastomonas sp.]MDM7957363.1 endonuclease domain-containing protein [Blastomonas sp.]
MLRSPRALVKRSRKLRKAMSLPEVLLWQELRKRPSGLKFRRQHTVGHYVLDFFCAEASLCIEIDGEQHNAGDQPEFDDSRGAWLDLHGIKTLRINAADVLNNLESVVEHIVDIALQRLPLHRPADGPPPRAGEDLGAC